MLTALGHLLYRHRLIVVAVWTVVVLVALPIAARVFQVLGADGFSSSELEAARADAVLAQRFGFDPGSLFLIYEDPQGHLPATDPRFQGDVEASVAGLPSLPEVAGVISPAQNPRQLAPDGHAAYVVVTLHSVPADPRPLLNTVEQALRPTELRPTLTGQPVFLQDILDVTESDLRRAELISLPFAAGALLLVFRSVTAAILPGLAAAVAITVALAAMVGLSKVADLSIFSLNLATLLGLGLGIDYSLFIVSRFREELGHGKSVEEAIVGSISTAGRAVLVSGSTVAAGLLGLLVFEFNALWSLGVAGALVVCASVLAALTLLPALLGLLGNRVDALSFHLPFRRSSSAAPEPGSGFWSRLARAVMGHPIRIVVPLVVVLAGLGLPFTRVTFGAPDASILPTSVQSRAGFDLLREHWGEGEVSPLVLVFQTTDGGSPLTPEHIGSLYDFLQRVRADVRVERIESLVSIDSRLTRGQYEQLYAVSTPELMVDAYARVAAQTTVRGNTTVARVTTRFGQTDDRSKALVRAIRATPPPDGFTLLVGGGTAGVVDYVDTLYQEFPRAAGFVVLAIYGVLFVMFRSVALPFKAIVMNSLSLLASYGALVVVFQDGVGSDLLRFRPLGFVEASLPIVLFCVLFGLSMDYEVFLLSRVKEAHDAGADTVASVTQGLERSGRIITSAAAIVVLVSLSFIAADIVLIKALGLGTAIAVFLDATIVRALLVPATMRLLGEWNWWAPKWLHHNP